MDDFRQKLLLAFPPQPFRGVVSTHDECDDGISLRKELPGKRWDEIPPEFLDFHSGSLPLLEPAALQAFLPAWLQRSMETLDEPRVLSEFTMFFLSPGNEDEGWDEAGIAERAALFTPAQRVMVADFLRCILVEANLKSWHIYAEQGLRCWSV
jgi:hypothetical protein